MSPVAAIRNNRLGARLRRPLRVLLDTPRGVWRGENLGDVAMCRGAVRRCLLSIRSCKVAVVVDDPQVLGREARWIAAVPSTAREHWLRDPGCVGARPFAVAFDAADVVATAGHGALVDLIKDGAIDHLRVLARARERGARTALLGHGIGPIEDPVLRFAAAEVLPGIDLICVRESALALPLLAQLGVARNRVAVTGDDALEVALPRRTTPGAERRAIGLSLRLSGIDRTQAAEIAGAARALAAARGLTLEPLPIDHSDSQILRELGMPCDLPSGIEPLLEAAGRCRAIIAGSYHACIFGLAQGTPVVAVAATDFYRGKMAGLATWFPSGCEILDVAHGDLQSTTRFLLERAVKRAEGERSELIRSAARQAEAGRTALAGLLAQAQAAVPREGPRESASTASQLEEKS